LTRDILEKAFDKTKELEQKHIKKMKLAHAIGLACGWTAAIALDALVVWAILKFMIGVQVGFVAVFGGLALFALFMGKLKVFTS
jgi:small-conductance mechanosensitive channel